MPPWEYREGRLLSRVCREGDGVRAYLRHVMHFPAHTLSALGEDAILLDGEAPPYKTRLRVGQILSVDLREERNPALLPRPLPFSVLYEDEHILAVSKPPLMPTHPSHGHQEDTLANAVAYRALSRGEDFPIRPVNRLDRDTSGVVLFSKHRLAAARLAWEMAGGMMQKQYIALTRPAPCPLHGRIHLPIARVPQSVMLRQVTPGGEEAITDYRTVVADKGIAALAVFPKTGRTHQIRVHLSHIGAPILGDFLYGKEDPCIGRQALHARALSFFHPMTGEKLEILAPLPQDMAALLPPDFEMLLAALDRA